MSEPFLAEVRIVGFNFAPRGWAFCDGQILPINQNQSLYSLLGTTYGGDGRTSFALPDLRGRTPIHTGSSNGGASHALGQKSGEEEHTLMDNEMPQHKHTFEGSTADVTTPNPPNNLLGTNTGNPYHAVDTLQPMNENSVALVGGGQSHQNMMPYLVVNFCIALQGLFPSRS